MSIAAVVIKIMPDAPDTNLENIKATAKTNLEKEGAQHITFEEKPVAFGLKAIFLKAAIPEDKGTDMVEETLQKIEHVSSVTIEDYRRAFG